jgi:hypothetical protein
MAFDVFYLTDAQGQKLAVERWPDILSHLEEALQVPARAQTAHLP